MARLSNPTKIVKENIPTEFRKLAEGLGQPYNDFSEQVYNALNKNLTVDDNFNMQYKDIQLQVNSDGTPLLVTQYQSNLKTKVRGMQVFRLQNLTNPTIYPTSAPFITFSENNKVITINHITGLSSGYVYLVTILAAG